MRKKLYYRLKMMYSTHHITGIGIGLCFGNCLFNDPSPLLFLIIYILLEWLTICDNYKEYKKSKD